MKTRLLFLAALLLLTAAVVIFAPKSVSPQIPEEHQPIPEDYCVKNNFTFQDAAEVSWQLSDFSGRPSVVCFWSSWSSLSRDELAVLNESLKLHEEDVYFLAMNVGKRGKDSLKKALRVYESGAYDFPLYVDSTGVIRFNVTSVPHFFFFDENGNLVSEAARALTSEQVEDEIAALLG